MKSRNLLSRLKPEHSRALKWCESKIVKKHAFLILSNSSDIRNLRYYEMDSICWAIYNQPFRFTKQINRLFETVVKKEIRTKNIYNTL